MDLETHLNQLAAKHSDASQAPARLTLLALISVTIILVLAGAIAASGSLSLPISQANAIARSIDGSDGWPTLKIFR